MFRALDVIVLAVTCTLVSWSPSTVAGTTTTTAADCLPGYYLCETGYCIPNSYLCDGITDCLGGSDERDCSTDVTKPPTTTTIMTSSAAPCPPGYYTCESGSCIPNSYLCDGFTDCLGGSDERDCSTDVTEPPTTTTIMTSSAAPCPPGYYTCESGSCIPISYLCDGFTDCLGGSDEQDCSTDVTKPPTTTTIMTSSAAPCAPGYYPCNTGYCIPNYYLCDGYPDCLDASDEQGCYSPSSYTTDVTKPPTTTTISPITTVVTITTTTTTTTATQSTSSPGNDCFLPFQSVSGRCVFVDPFVEGTWPEMRYRCNQFGAVLLEVDEPNFFLSIVQFINETGLESTSYWTGGRKDAEGERYYWDGSNTNVEMGTPFWAIYSPNSGASSYDQEPDASGSLDQCVLLNEDRRLFFSDMDCSATVAGVVCQRDPGPVDSPSDKVTQCSLDNFACDYTSCVSWSKVCDGVKNCRNNADEAFCHRVNSTNGVSWACADTHFRCGNGNCVWSEYVCDGDNDCSDFSDERNCDAISTTTGKSSTTLLPSTASLLSVTTTTLPKTTLLPKTSHEGVLTMENNSTNCSNSPPYHSVGGKCIFVEPFVEVSWEQMRYRCKEFGGIPLEVEDPNFFMAVVEYITENGINNRGYWIGGRKDADDDIFYWDGSRTNVTMGTPFWAIYYIYGSGYGQDPYGVLGKEQCVFLNKDRKLFFSATDCDVTTSGVICERPLDQSSSIDVTV